LIVSPIVGRRIPTEHSEQQIPIKAFESNGIMIKVGRMGKCCVTAWTASKEAYSVAFTLCTKKKPGTFKQTSFIS
jgi:hypothetical protein